MKAFSLADSLSMDCPLPPKNRQDARGKAKGAHSKLRVPRIEADSDAFGRGDAYAGPFCIVSDCSVEDQPSELVGQAVDGCRLTRTDVQETR